MNRIDIVARGADDQVWHQWYALDHGGGPTVPWEPLGVYTYVAPAISARAPNVLDIAWVGYDAGTRHGYYTVPTGWVMSADLLRGNAAGNPVTTSWGPGRVDISVVGIDDTIAHQAWDNTTGSAWSGWVGTPNTNPAHGAIAETSSRYQELDTWWLSTGALRRERWAYGSWWAPTADSFPIAHVGALAAVAMPGTTSRVDVFTQDATGIYHSVYNDPIGPDVCQSAYEFCCNAVWPSTSRRTVSATGCTRDSARTAAAAVCGTGTPTYGACGAPSCAVSCAEFCCEETGTTYYGCGCDYADAKAAAQAYHTNCDFEDGVCTLGE